MVEVLDVIVSAPKGLTSAHQSIKDLAALAAQLPACATHGIEDGATKGFLGGLMLGDDVLDLLVREPICFAARGAHEVQSFEIHPSDRYLETFTAIAARREAHVFFRHGWPILSLESDSTSMTKAGGESIAPSGGAA